MTTHNRYRAAKRFKLDEDGEVVDQYSGHKKSHRKRDWDFYDGRRHSLYSQHHSASNRFLASKVGQKWDDVHSAYVSRTKTIGGYFGRDLRDSLRWKLYEHVEMRDDGVYNIGGSRWCGKLSNGDMYVHPVTGILCRTPAAKPKRSTFIKRSYSYWEREPRHYGLKVVMDGTTEYVRELKEYKLRVAPGVFKTETVFVWYKYVTYEYKWTDYKLAKDRVGNYLKDAEGNYVKIFEVKTETRWRKYQASKQAIKKYGLTYEEV